MRSAKSSVGEYSFALDEYEIPVISDQGSDFFAEAEIMAICNLLRIIDNPRQDVPLIAALRSSLFSFSADELAQIRSMDRQSDFYAAMQQAAPYNERVNSF